eukprot:gb/GECG01008584.1/.p1 GENE.gb/GECG01008584.1/~~gb/GECG01008584.1/.p1  ORF type:complete len:104 (+),score=21.99 gb/GECG01008584.1/:1-312(+)
MARYTLKHLIPHVLCSQEKTIKQATFNLKLSEKEKQDKAKLQLPYTRSSQNAAVAGDAAASATASRPQSENAGDTPRNLIYVEPGDEDTDSDDDDDVDDDLDI